MFTFFIVCILTVSTTKCLMFMTLSATCITAKISRTYVHPNYNADRNDKDIALLRLREPLTFSEHVRPVCVASSDLLLSSTCYATGWGWIECKHPWCCLFLFSFFFSFFFHCVCVFLLFWVGEGVGLIVNKYLKWGWGWGDFLTIPLATVIEGHNHTSVYENGSKL